MSAPASTSVVAIKAVFLRSATNTEVRRVAGPEFVDFRAVEHQLRALWSPSSDERLTIEYLDDEGDRVRVETQTEWNEARRVVCQLAGAAVIRLTVFSGVRPENVAPTTADAAAASRCSGGFRRGCAGRAARHGQGGDLGAHIRDIISALCGGEAASSAPSSAGCCRPNASCGAAPSQRARSADTTAATDVDAQGHAACDATKANEFAKAAAIQQCNRLIEAGAYQLAEAGLAAAMAVWPQDPVFPYNAACAAALRGDKTAAFQLLERAVGLGYVNHQHMCEDADLASLRDDDRFLALAAVVDAQLTAQKRSANEAPQPQRAPAKEQPMSDDDVVIVDVPTSDPVAELMAAFPHLDQEQAEAAITAHGGSATVAAAALADSM